ncbi:MAG: MscL family protein [Candidatus Liptonbacteria bacterium]
MQGFLDFIRKQGVVGLAVGFILGASVAKVVSSLVQDIIQPILGLILGGPEGLNAASFSFFGSTVKYGSFIAALIDFLIIAAVVYYGVKLLRLDKLDAKKD